MPTISESIWVDAPRERVWRLVSDPSRYPEWIDFVQEILYTSDGPMREGYVYRERAKPGPKVTTSDWRITRWEPPRLQVHKGSMPEMEAELRITLEPDREGTLWFHEMDFRMMPKFRPLGWVLERLVVKRKMQATFRRILGNAKRLLEEEARAAPSSFADRCGAP